MGVNERAGTEPGEDRLHYWMGQYGCHALLAEYGQPNRLVEKLVNGGLPEPLASEAAFERRFTALMEFIEPSRQKLRTIADRAAEFLAHHGGEKPPADVGIRAFMTEAHTVNAALESLCATRLAELPSTSSDHDRETQLAPLLGKVRALDRAAGFDLIELSRPVLRVEQIDQGRQRPRSRHAGS